MYIPEISELNDLLDTINIDVNNSAHVVAIAELRVKLRSILDTFELSRFSEGSSEKLNQLIEDMNASDEMIKAFGPYMVLYLLQRT
jgi:hypothetical protein